MDTELFTDLVLITPKIGTVVEAALQYKYGLRHRIGRTRPTQRIARNGVHFYFKFSTVYPASSFAMDYPTDEQVMKFHKDFSLISPDGFEMIDFDNHHMTW